MDTKGVCIYASAPFKDTMDTKGVCIHASAPFKDTMDTKGVYTCISPLPWYHGCQRCVYMHQPPSKIPWIPRVCVYMHQPPSKIPWIPRVCIHASAPFHDTMDAKGVYTCTSPLPRYHGYRVCVSTRYHGYQGCVYRHQHLGTIACQHNNNIDLIDTMDTKGVCIGLYISPLPRHHEYQVCELMHQPPTPPTPPPHPHPPHFQDAMDTRVCIYMHQPHFQTITSFCGNEQQWFCSHTSI